MIEDTLHVWAKNFLEYFGVYLLLGVLTAGVSLVTTFLLLGTPSLAGALGIPGITVVPTLLSVTVLAYAIASVVNAFITAIFLGAVSFFAFYAHRNARVTLSRAFSEGFSRFLSIFGAQILLSLIILGLFSLPFVTLVTGAVVLPPNYVLIGLGLLFLLLAFPFAIYLVVALSLFAPVIMVERVGALEGLRRSWILTRGRRLSIFGAGLVIGIIVVLIETAVVAGAGLGGVAGGPGVVVLFSVIGAAFASGLVGALFAILAVVAYSLIRADEETKPQVPPYPGGYAPAATPPTAPAAPPPSEPSGPPPGAAPPPPGP